MSKPAHSPAQLIDEALQLAEPDRAEMARRLLLSLEPDDFDSGADEVWAAEIERRLDAVEQGNFRASDWREVVDRVRASLRDDNAPGHAP